MDFALCRTHRLLQEIPPTALEEMLRDCTLRQLPPGEVLLEPGTPNHTLFFVLTGQLQVKLRAEDDNEGFAILPGELIGEMSIIERRPVVARVIAALPTTLLAMPETVFLEVYCSRPSLIPPLLQSLVTRMRKTNAVLREEFERHVRYEMLQRDLESAAKIQSNILPSYTPLFDHPAVEIHTLCKPARTVGGDFYDAVTAGPNRLAVAIGDVSGKGLPAALFMVRVVTSLRLILQREADPTAILPELNRQLCAANDELMFVTLAILLLDPANGRVIYLNAGHNPALLARPGQPFEILNPPAGPLLGVHLAGKFELQEHQLLPGESIVLYTDGVTEAENGTHDQFGIRRTASALSTPPMPTSPAGLVGRLEKALHSFVGEADQSDDITVLALRYRGQPSETVE